MVEPREKEAKRLVKAFAVLVRNTAWKCGRVEWLVVGCLRAQLTDFGHVGLPVREILLLFKLNGKKKNEFFDAIKRLEKRRIIEIQIL